MDHLALAVSDRDRSRRFYERYLGFEAEAAPREDGALMLHNASGFALALGADNGGDPRPCVPALRDRLPTPDEVRAFRDRIAADGIEIVGEWEEPDYVSVKFRDPDGYVVEVGWESAR